MPFLIGAIFFAVVMILFAIAAALDWGGDRADDDPDNDYCERIHPGKIKQPVNTWSDMGFVAVGLGILAFLSVAKPSAADIHRNPMMTGTAWSILFGCVVIWLGPGSMFYHASQKIWGGWLDSMSMNLFISFVFWYDLARALDWSIGWFFLGYILTNVALGLLKWFVRWNPLGIVVFAVLIVVTAVVEFWAALSGHYDREWWWLLGVGLSFGAGLGVWLPSRTGGPWCKPDSIWQGHAAWHLFSAQAALFTFIYLRSEG
jgi:hypothetical protein